MAIDATKKPGEDELAKTIGMWLRTERQKQGLTQRAVAQGLGLTDGVPAQWEHGRFMPRADRLMRIVVVFGFSLATLITMLNDGSAATGSARRK